MKCDEARPECTPCVRLGHTCDYNPRLSFKDDTPRVIERISGGRGAPGPVWNPRPGKRQYLYTREDDLLPSFASLRNDEDRERKAEFRKPGTYQVIVNPASFVDYGEYRDKDGNGSSLGEPISKYPSSTQTPNDRLASHPFQFANTLTSNVQISDDPDIIVLKVFQDDSQKMTPSPGGLSAVQGRSSRASTLSNSSTLSLGSSVSTICQHMSPARYAYENSPLMQMAHPDGRDHQLIYYYKNFVYRHLLQVHRDSLGTPSETDSISSADIFERQAVTFPPVSHICPCFNPKPIAISTSSTNITC